VQRGVGTAALTTTQFSYDARGLQIGRSDGVNTALVRSVSQTVDAFGRVTSDTDALGTVTTHAYDRLGRQLSQSRTVEGRVESVSTTYDAFDRTLTQTNALGKITSYLHSDSNRSLTVTSPEGVAITTVHNRFGQTVTVSQVLADGSTATTTYSYDKNGALLSSTNALGEASTNVYDVRGLLASSTDASGRQVAYTYDARGRVLSRIEDPTGLALTTTTVYDGQGRQLTVTDGSGRVTAMSYDREGRLLQTAQDPSGLNLRTAYSYDVLGRQVSVTEAAGTSEARTVSYSYDELGRRASETVAPGTLNLVTTYVYDKNDNLVTRTDAGGNLTRFVYDQANRLRFSVNALGGITQTVYDAAGRATITRSYAKAANISTLGATAPATLAQVQGLITNQTLTNDAVDSVGYRVYDNDGRVRFSVDALYGVQASVYDSAGRLTATRSYAKAIVNAGLISKLKAGTAVVADFTASTLVADDARDARSFVVQDAVGRARFTVDGSGFVNELRYDAAGRVIERHAYNTSDATLLAAAKAGTATVASFASFVTANAAGARTSASVFDAAGRIAYTLTRSDATQAIVSERRYDAAGRVIGEVAYGKTIAYATGQTVAQIATALSNAGANAASAQRLTQYVHDAAGRLRFSLNDAGVVSEQSYNALGQVVATRIYGTPISTAAPTEASVSAAVTGQTNVRLTSYMYDNAGRLASTTDALNKTETYGYDALGRRTTFTNKAGFTWTTVYNALGQTTEERSPAVQVARYNTAGTLVVESKSIVTRMTYDALGNLVSRTENAAAADAADARTTQYVYDARGRQIKTIFPDAYKINTSGALVASGILPEINITYDALDRAVVQKDVRNNYSYKVYNALGQLAYDIDAEGYVTSYAYNAYGEQSGLTRHANPINIAGQGSVPLTEITVSPSSADRTLTMSYDSRGNKVAVTQPTVSYVKADGTSANGTPRSEFTYDAYNNLVKESVLLDQANGVWAHTFHYFDELGQRTRSVNAEGYVTAWQYTAFGQVSEQLEFARAIPTTGLTTATVPGTPVAGDAASGYDRGVLYVYDALGRKLSESVLRTYQNANGTSASAYVVTNLEYDNADHVTAMTVAGNRTETDYDALGRTIAVTEQARDVLVADWQTKLSQSNLNDLDKSTLYVSASPHTAMVYDAFGNTIKTTRSGLGERNGVVTASATDQVTTTRYDRQGRAVLATDATGKLVTISYDAADNVLTQSYKLIDRDNHNSTVVSTFTYDASNRQLTQKTERTLYSGATVTEATQAVAYNAFGEITSKADTLAALSNATTSAMYEYDAAGRIVRSNAESGTYRRYGYNLAGVQVKEERDWTEAGVGKTAVYRQSVDRLGRVTQVISPAYSSDASAPVATTTVRLDRWGNVLEQIDARGYSTQMYYNDQNKLIRQLAPLVKVVSESGVESWIRPETSWRYDALGRLIAEVDANGHTHTYEYDTANRMFRSFDANASATRVAYDALGQKLATQDARGHLTYVDYDVAGRATVQGDYLLDASGSTRAKVALQTFTLDQNGNRLTVKDALNNTQKYDYDSNGKLTRSQTAVGEVVTYAYDVQGRKTKETRGSYNLEWGYDYFGRTTSHKDMALVNFTYAYDARSGQQTSISQSGVSRTLTYYANGQVRTISEGATVYSYQYDAVGNRTLEETVTTDGDGQSVHVVTHTYYDSLNRISRVTSDDAVYNVRMLDVSYDYDAVGNRRRVVADSSYGPGAAPVSTADRAPIVIAAPDTQTLEGGVAKVWSLRASDIFRDPESTPMTYAVTKADGSVLPSWLTVNYDAATGLLIFTATSGSSAAQGTTIGLKITARDLNGAGQTATANFNLSVIVNHAPVVANVIPNKSAPVNLPWSFTFAANTFSDQDGQTLTYSATGMPDGIAFDPNTRTFSGTPTTSGSYVITVTASDGSLSVATNFTVSTEPNDPPVLVNTIADQSIMPSLTSSWSFTVPANTFSDTDQLTITQNGMPSWMSFSSATQTFSGSGKTVGSSTITVTATDLAGQSVSTTFVVTVLNADPVLVTPIADKTATVGQTWTFPVPDDTFVDPNNTSSGGHQDRDNQVLTYSAALLVETAPGVWEAQALPSWLIFAASSVVFTGTPPAAGSWTLRLSVSDGAGGSASTQFTLTAAAAANQAPTVENPIADQTAVRSQPFTFTFPTSTFSDANGDTLTYSYAQIVGTASWLSFNASTRTFSGSPGSTDGNVTIRLTATDPAGLSVYEDFVINVTGGGTNAAPTVVNPIADQTAVRGQAFTFTVPANTFTDPNGDNLTYTYTKVGTSAWLNYNSTTRTFSGNTPTSTGADTITIQYTATDAGGLSVTDTFVITLVAAGSNVAPTIANPIADQTAVRGQAFTFTVPANTFADANGDNLTYSYTKVGASAWLNYDAATRTFSGNTPASNGADTITIQYTATDPAGLSVTDTFVISLVVTLSNSAPVVANPIADQNAVRQQAWSFTFPATTFSDANGDTLTYTYSKIVGTASWLSFNASTRTFSGTPGSTDGNVTIRLTATDGGGLSVYEDFVINVTAGGTNVAPTVAIPLSDQAVIRSEAYSFSFAANAFTDANGDALTYTATQSSGGALPSWLAFNATTRTFSGTPGQLASTTTVRVTATDGAGLSVYDDFIVTVEEAAGGGSFSMEAARTSMETDSTSSMTIAPEETYTATSSPTDPGSTPNRQEVWFTYDAENRVQVVNGMFDTATSSIIVSGYKSWSQQYDAVGNVASKTTVDDYDGTVLIAKSEYTLRGELAKTYHRTTLTGNNGVGAVYTYDAAGHLKESTSYFGNDDQRSVWVETIDKYDNYFEGYVSMNVGGWLYAHVTYTYDADGRLKTEHTDGRGKDWANAFADYVMATPNMHIAVPTTESDQQKTSLGVLTSLSTLAYTKSDETSGYDSLGRVTTHRYLHIADGESVGISHGAYTTTFSHTYIQKEGFLETVVAATVEGDPLLRDGKTESTYDAWGRRTSLTETTPLTDYDTELTSKRFFSYDAEGGILTRRDGTLVDGVFTQEGNGWAQNAHNPAPQLLTAEQWAALTEAERKAWQGKAMNQHFVYSNRQQIGQVNEAGEINVADKLTAFKNSDTGAGMVAVNDGDTLQSIAQRVYGNGSLWYVLADANAVTDKTLFTGQMLKTPQVQTNKNDSATFKPYNPAEVIGPTEPGTPYIAKPEGAGGCGVIGKIIMAVVLVVVAIYAPYLVATLAQALGPALGVFATAAAAGIVGAGASVVTQGVGSVLGLTHFSWKQVAADGITAAITAGASSYLSNTSTFGKAVEAGRALNRAGQVASQVINYAGSVVANAAVGRDAHFSWGAVAATAVGAYVSSYLPEFKFASGNGPTSKFVNDFGNSFVKGGVTAEIRHAFGQGDVNWRQIAIDAFGNALGNAVVRGMQGGSFSGSKPPAAENGTSASGFGGTEQFSMLDWSLNNGNSFDTSVGSVDNGVYSASAQSAAAYTNVFTLPKYEVAPASGNSGVRGDGFVHFEGIADDAMTSYSVEQWTGATNNMRTFINYWNGKGANLPSLPGQPTNLDVYGYFRDIALPLSQQVMADALPRNAYGIATSSSEYDALGSTLNMSAGAAVGVPIAFGQMALETAYGLGRLLYVQQGEAVYGMTAGLLGQDAHQDYLQIKAGVTSFASQPVAATRSAVVTGVSGWYNGALDAHNKGHEFTYGMRISRGAATAATMAPAGIGAVRMGTRGLVSLVRAADEIGFLPVASRSGPRLGGQVGAINPGSQVVVTPVGGEASVATRLGNRRLPDKDMPWVAYQEVATGKSYEELWQLNQQVIALDARTAGYTVEAKWAGRNNAAWESSPYHPDHRFYNEAKILDQASRQLDLNAATGGKGVRFAISNEAAQQQFTMLFEQHFPSQVGNGMLSVWYVPGNGMRYAR
jgi:YD repeat-containing protein